MLYRKLQSLLSYLVPIPLKTYYSEWSGRLEINLINGQKVLDTRISNYSYGALQKTLYRGLREISFTSQAKQVLVLGMGGGSVIQTLREKFYSTATIDAVEIDPVVIQIAREEFQMERYQPLNIIEADAYDFVFECTQNYDIIIVDVFLGNKIPKKITELDFYQAVLYLLKPGGSMLFNVMKVTYSDEKLEQLLSSFENHPFTFRVIRNILRSNHLIIATRN